MQAADDIRYHDIDMFPGVYKPGALFRALLFFVS